MKPSSASPQTYQPPFPKPYQPMGRIITLMVASVMGLAAIWFLSGNMVIGGVPSSIILTFLQDPPAREAYFQGNRKALHDRLSDLGIEAQIKAYYRPQIPDETQLDLYIHQLLYNRTGYVGEAYSVTDQGRLIPK
jgi:hypothetical protein